jgi:hypothetical protein
LLLFLLLWLEPLLPLPPLLLELLPELSFELELLLCSKDSALLFFDF